MKTPISVSEEHGLAALPQEARSIYSVGVSTAGAAEIRMAEANPKRHIIATTIDTQGVVDSQKVVTQQGLDNQIEVKLEDVSQTLPYADSTFDYIYARLVLHYLTKQQLPATLAELHRTLKPGGVLFIVVRSTKNIDASPPRASNYDEHTGLTTYTTRPNTEIAEVRKRFFHTPESMANYVQNAGFTITHQEQYDERLFHDYRRTIQAQHSDNLIEIIATK
jgi:cyclopropane fatty-acyl-phospholipid synthase-like methyltransferase